MTMNCVSSYYLTLLAHDPDVSQAEKTFQVRIDEKSFGSLDLTCSVARIKEEAKGEGDSAKEPFIPPHYHGGPEASVSFVGELPRWPSDADRDRDYQSKLEIVNVIIETRADDSETSKERLKAKSAHVCITFKGLAEPQAPRQSFEVGEHVERRAIVRRVICESTGAMSILGKLCGGKFTGKQAAFCDTREWRRSPEF
ncbi:hypothetical protein Bca4012_056063 [Brassica carinata]